MDRRLDIGPDLLAQRMDLVVTRGRREIDGRCLCGRAGGCRRRVDRLEPRTQVCAVHLDRLAQQADPRVVRAEDQALRALCAQEAEPLDLGLVDAAGHRMLARA